MRHRSDLIRSDLKFTTEKLKALCGAGIPDCAFRFPMHLGNSLSEDVFHQGVALMEKVGRVVDMQVDAEIRLAKPTWSCAESCRRSTTSGGRSTNARAGRSCHRDVAGPHPATTASTLRFTAPIGFGQRHSLRGFIRTARLLIAAAPDHVVFGRGGQGDHLRTPDGWTRIPCCALLIVPPLCMPAIASIWIDAFLSIDPRSAADHAC